MTLRELGGALATRAWTLQELVFPPRILHFGSRQAYFECNMSRACEGFVYTDLKLSLFQAEVYGKGIIDVFSTELYRSWDHLLEAYGRRKLTYGDDALPALSGLAALFQSKLHDTYCAGLWESDLIIGLQWQLDDFGLRKQRSTRTAKHVGPSWSWAAPNCATSYYHIFTLDDLYGTYSICHYSMRDFHTVAHTEVLSVRTSRLDENRYGQLITGQIELVGKIQPVKIGRLRDHQFEPRPVYAVTQTMQRVAHVIMDTPPHEDMVKPQAEEDFDTATDAFCLLLCSGYQWTETHISELKRVLGIDADAVCFGFWSGLALEPVPGMEKTFRRVGFVLQDRCAISAPEPVVPAELADMTNWWDDTEPQTIVLI